MALLTDGSPNDTEGLRVYETAILSVANVEGIDLDAKLGLAAEEVSEDVLDILLDHAGIADLLGSIRRRVGVTDVVVTPQLKRWHALHTLAIVYRDAYNNQLNDRYKTKWDEYGDLSRNSRDITLRFGVGLVAVPVPAAATPALSNVAGTQPSSTYYARASWVSESGEEGLPSAMTTFTTADGSLLVVAAVNPPAVAAGWNVYIGLSDATLGRQNASPIAIGQNFTLPSCGLVSGAAPGNGQSPDSFVTGGRMLRRG